MTREMAIEQLTRHRQEFAHDHGWSGSVLDALDVAIEALQTEPIEVEAAKEQKAYNKGFDDCRQAMLKMQTETCEDAISRSHFDERVRLAGGMADEELTQDFKDGVLTVLEMLKTEPSVTPQNVGKWVKISPAGIYECSLCGKNVMTSDICTYGYCHGCGAKMGEGE